MKDPKKMYDKNEVKSNIKKYLIIAVCFLPIMILLNFTVFYNLSSGLMIFLDVVLCVGFVFVISMICNAVDKKRTENSEQNVVIVNKKKTSKVNNEDNNVSTKSTNLDVSNISLESKDYTLNHSNDKDKQE